MIKTIVFDLDGVLIESKEIHYKALNDALPPQYRISYEEWINYLNGFLLTAIGRLMILKPIISFNIN